MKTQTRRVRCFITASMLTLLLAAAGHGKTIYVSPSGDDANNGASWAASKATVQAALGAAVSGDAVWVAAGVYYSYYPGKYSGFYLPGGVALYGGFAGSETSLSERDWTRNPSILDGSRGSTMVETAYASSGATRVDGFVIRNGRTGISWEGDGIIANNVIVGNRGVPWAGGIQCEHGSPLIANNRIVGNYGSRGGGIACLDGSPMILNNLVASNDAADKGGAIYVDNASPTIINNTFIGNWGNWPTGTGGIFGRWASSSCLVANNIVAFNQSGLSFEAHSPLPLLRNNCVYGNTDGNYFGVADPTGTQGNISADPRMADLTYGNLHIQPDSPCREGGNNAHVQPGWPDIDGQPRVQGTVDIGADESDGTAWPPGPYAIVRVSPQGDDANDGGSWATPKRSVQEAITAASARGGEVWVKEGTFNECVTLAPYTSLYGGFAGTENTRDERKPGLHRTVLDGQQVGTVVTIARGRSAVTIDNFTIRNGAYGGIDSASACSLITNCTIVGNTNVAEGGGIRCGPGSTTIANCVVTGNSAGWFGGGIALWGGPSATIINCTIAQNSAGQEGGGVYFGGPDRTATLINTVVAFNSSGVKLDLQSTLISKHNCVYGNAAYDYSGLADPTGTDGNISADPGLADLTYGNMHIQPSSPCRDAGETAAVQTEIDIDGQPRVQGGGVDIGADESDGTIWSVQPAVIHVRPDGSDSNDGSSWLLAKQTVQAGIDAASLVGGDVWVAAGTYPERISLKAFAHVYGGFSGSEETRDARDWIEHGTILDGQKGGSVVTARSGYRSSTIDGFTIRNGQSSQGGGVYCAYSWPMIAHTTISGNAAASGGGVFCDYASPSIIRNVIRGNSRSQVGSYNQGGGIHCSYSRATILENLIADNPAAFGGGIYTRVSPVVIRDNVISGNTATADGGGIYVDNSNGLVAQVINNRILGNTAGSSGLGGGICCLYSKSLIVGNVICGNKARSGGGIHAPAVIVNNTVSNNTATSSGGGVQTSSYSVMANNVITLNSSGVQFQFYNIGAPGPAHNCVYDNGAYDYSGITDPTGTNGNVSVNPRFVRTPSPGTDGQWGTDDDDYGDVRLQVTSSCIDAGQNAGVPAGILNDLSGRPRFVDTPGTVDTGAGTPPIVDMGAYEYQPTAAADFNDDGRVDATDLDIFGACRTGPAIAYPADNPPSPGGCPLWPDAGRIILPDFDADGDVDQADFGVLQRCFSGAEPAVIGCDLAP